VSTDVSEHVPTQAAALLPSLHFTPLELQTQHNRKATQNTTRVFGFVSVKTQLFFVVL